MAMQALVMGFGGTGAHILTWLKELTVLKHGSKPDSLKFLLFDTIADWRPGKTVQILGGTAEEIVAKGAEEKNSLDPATEYFYLRDHDPDLRAHVFELLAAKGTPEKLPHLKDWLHAPWLKVHVRGASLNIVEGAAQQRQIGRFAIFQNADRVISKVTQMIDELARHAGNSAVNVWLVGSAAGGTGAGCLLDAAYLTRKAAGDVDITVTGVIAMPDVYNDKPGISRARAYSLFRELGRLQGLGIAPGNAEAQMEFTSRVFYDSKKQISSSVPKGIFDDLFYIGKPCNQEKDREVFFTSAANAIDPYLDEFSGPVLIQEAVNKTAPALSFGASRLYVPEETYADIFAWEEVEKYLRGLTAPDNRRYLHHGSPDDRQQNATRKVRNILPLFGELLDRAEDREDLKRAYVKNTVTSQKIITEWYRFGAGSIAGIELGESQRAAVMLAYINPYISYLEADDTKVLPADRETKTFKENERAKGAKESQDDSRNRFAEDLNRITKRYLDANAGERSLEKGRRQVREVIKANLQDKVDEQVLAELRQSVKFTVDGDSRQGTVLTRLWAELDYALADNGPLKKIEATIGQFITALNEEEAAREKQPVEVLNQLRESKAGGWYSLGVWVEDYQSQARDTFFEYLQWYQKRELLRDTQTLCRDVIARFQQWSRLMKQVFEHLALGEPHSSLFTVTEKILKKELYGRLQRLGKNTSARISCAPFNSQDPDLDMQGYRAELKKSVYIRPDETLADATLLASKWEAVVGDDGTPGLKLVISNDAGRANSYGADTLVGLHQVLHDQYRRRMAGTLGSKDIFDYLLYAQRTHGLKGGDIAKILSESAEMLLNAKGDEECRLIYRGPQDPDKVNLAEAIQGALGALSGLIVKDAEKTHSDKNSITLLKLKKPNSDEIQDLNRCKEEYLAMQVETTNGSDSHDTEVYRAQVYHPFRAELEAWYIERKYCRKHGERAEGHQIPPRMVRLLDEPAMMQAFVHCLATGAVERTPREEDGREVWVWHDTQNSREVSLVSTPKADVVQAGVVFGMQQREGRRGGLIQITAEGATKSAFDSAKRKEKTKAQMLAEFRKNLEPWVNDHLEQDQMNDNTVDRKRKEQERLGMQMVLDFYADPDTVTEIQFRMDL